MPYDNILYVMLQITGFCGTIDNNNKAEKSTLTLAQEVTWVK